jgi:hypothetical protein
MSLKWVNLIWSGLEVRSTGWTFFQREMKWPIHSREFSCLVNILTIYEFIFGTIFCVDYKRVSMLSNYEIDKML